MQQYKFKNFFVVANEKGLHTRPSTELVKCAAMFKSQITLRYQDVTVNAKSLLGILMLAAARGSRIYVEAEGDDAEEAVKTIIDLARNKFNMETAPSEWTRFPFISQTRRTPKTSLPPSNCPRDCPQSPARQLPSRRTDFPRRPSI